MVFLDHDQVFCTVGTARAGLERRGYLGSFNACPFLFSVVPILPVLSLSLALAGLRVSLIPL